ncbi:MAG TPA: nucleotidyltransferase family protein [Coriobacteriia bacterium]
MSATKAAYAAELTAVMQRDGVSRAELARRMHSDRSTVGRVLDPADESVTVATLSRAAAALGREPAVALAPERPSALLARHRETLARIAAGYGLQNVRVFGSVARGDDTPASDLDLVADFPEGYTFELVADAIEDLSVAFGRRVDLLNAAIVKPRLRGNVLRESVPL